MGPFKEIVMMGGRSTLVSVIATSNILTLWEIPKGDLALAGPQLILIAISYHVTVLRVQNLHERPVTDRHMA